MDYNWDFASVWTNKALLITGLQNTLILGFICLFLGLFFGMFGSFDHDAHDARFRYQMYSIHE